jgi:hypothetical protein
MPHRIGREKDLSIVEVASVHALHYRVAEQEVLGAETTLLSASTTREASSRVCCSAPPSTDGGATFADPVAAVTKDGSTHFLDKNWFTFDPTNPKRLFVSYTDFDFSGTVCPPSPLSPRVAIEMVSSHDGGVSFGAPVVLAEVCSAPPNFPFVQGSQVSVGPSGEVYVAWESYPTFLTREIDVRKSLNHGASFSSPWQK